MERMHERSGRQSGVHNRRCKRHRTGDWPALAEHGLRVVLSDINDEALAAAASDFPGPVATVVLDVRDRAQWASARMAAEAAFGPIDVLVNNAGIMNEGTSANFMVHGLINQSPESFDRMIGINLVGVYNGIHEFGPGMAERRQGHIVNTSSTQGIISCGGVAAYCAASSAWVGMSEALRQELEQSRRRCLGALPRRSTDQSGEQHQPAGWPAAGRDARGLRHVSGDCRPAVVDAIKANELYIITHGEYIVPLAQRHARILAAAEKMPISPIYNPHAPLPGTPEFAAMKAVASNTSGNA